MDASGLQFTDDGKKLVAMVGKRLYWSAEYTEKWLYREPMVYEVESVEIADNTEKIGERTIDIEAVYQLRHGWTPWVEIISIQFSFVPNGAESAGMLIVERKPRGGKSERQRVFVSGWRVIDVLWAIAKPHIVRTGEMGDEARAALERIGTLLSTMLQEEETASASPRLRFHKIYDCC